jgi:hypothetical protein
MPPVNRLGKSVIKTARTTTQQRRGSLTPQEASARSKKGWQTRRTHGHATSRSIERPNAHVDQGAWHRPNGDVVVKSTQGPGGEFTREEHKDLNRAFRHIDAHAKPGVKTRATKIQRAADVNLPARRSGNGLLGKKGEAARRQYYTTKAVKKGWDGTAGFYSPGNKTITMTPAQDLHRIDYDFKATTTHEFGHSIDPALHTHKGKEVDWTPRKALLGGEDYPHVPDENMEYLVGGKLTPFGPVEQEKVLPRHPIGWANRKAGRMYKSRNSDYSQTKEVEDFAESYKWAHGYRDNAHEKVYYDEDGGARRQYMEKKFVSRSPNKARSVAKARAQRKPNGMR